MFVSLVFVCHLHVKYLISFGLFFQCLTVCFSVCLSCSICDCSFSVWLFGSALVCSVQCSLFDCWFVVWFSFGLFELLWCFWAASNYYWHSNACQSVNCQIVWCLQNRRCVRFVRLFVPDVCAWCVCLMSVPIDLLLLEQMHGNLCVVVVNHFNVLALCFFADVLDPFIFSAWSNAHQVNVILAVFRCCPYLPDAI